MLGCQGEAQDREHTHYGMLGDSLQQGLRQDGQGNQVRHVEQVDMDRVFSFLDGHVDNNGIANLLQETARQNRDDPQGLGFNKKELDERLPGFSELNRHEQAAAISVLGRLSPAVHGRYGVGASPERVNDPYRYEPGVDRSQFSAAERAKLTNDAGVADTSSRGMLARGKKNFWTKPVAKAQETFAEGNTQIGRASCRERVL